MIWVYWGKSGEISSHWGLVTWKTVLESMWGSYNIMQKLWGHFLNMYISYYREVKDYFENSYNLDEAIFTGLKG